jgi:hypothetical protein
MKGNQEGSDRAGGSVCVRQRRRDMTRMHRRPSALAVLLVSVAALALAACSGGSSSPQVASLGTSTSAGSSSGASGGSTATTQPGGNPIQLLDEWAACMRSHGDPSQADPTIDANKVIHIVMLPSVPGGLTGSNGQSSSGPGLYCATYLMTAQTALAAGQPTYQAPSQAQMLKYAECMRADGVSDFPDPTGGGLQFHGTPGSDLNPDNPVFQNAAKVCTKKTGVYTPAAGGPLPAGSIMEGVPGGPQQPASIFISAGNGGSGANG